MKDINDILAKHFSGETTAGEANLVNEWKRENEEEYAILSEAWKEADASLLENLEFKSFDHKAAWNKVDSQLIDEQKETKVIKMNFYKKVAAACAVLLVGLGAFWFLSQNKYSSLSNTANAPKEISLPDGSTVWLAANSTLEYTTDFKNERSLNLEGEAFFEVARDEAHPFIISTPNGEVEVLGTAFNVNTSAESMLVSVDHGRVAVRNENGDEVELTAGESATSSESGVSSVETDVNFDAWKTGEFEFEGTPLNEVIEMLNKHYETQVELLSDDKANESFVGSFKSADIKEIIDAISLTCGVDAEYGEDVIRLR